MSKTLYPAADTKTQNFASRYVGSVMSPNCLVVHSTEGTGWPSYSGGATAPHFTIMPDFDRKTVKVRQHFPIDRSARALENRSGGVQTNTLGVVQFELVGTCDPATHKKWGSIPHIYMPEAPDWFLEGVAAAVKWFADGWPKFEPVDGAPRGWGAYPASYGASKYRLSASEWLNCYGIVGHQHVPENGHGDPGRFPIGRLVELVTGAPPKPPVVDPPKPPARVTAVWGKPETWKIGSIGPDVTRLGQRLEVWAKALGLPKPYTVGPSPEFTETDRRALEAFQKAQGWIGAGADGYPGPETFKRLAAEPPAKPSVSKPHEYISANLADYDTVGNGEETAESRASKDIPNYLLPKAPAWFHFQECSKPTLDEMDKKFAAYTRIPEGGKGRESFYLDDAGFKILGAELSNVTHMFLKDTKEFLKIAWEDSEGYRGVYVNFHNENEGSTFQTLQLWDVMKAAVDYADKFGIDHRNIVITGDSNLSTARTFVKLKIYWREARDIAKKKIDLIYKTTHAWLGRLVKGSPIDVDIFHKDAMVDEAEMLFGVISDHFARRVVHRLFK